ncbi:MAG: hypothetical protein QOH05_2854 [Acetobacteraceae bacterium]|jgi:hypothetical protein|nr:hypothetical protein [Acetobacteraceae bacterium]
MLRASLATLALLAALPAVAQERGGVRMRDPTAVLSQIDANRGCPMSSTSVTVGVNKTSAFGSSAQQQLNTSGGGSSSCRPLVSTQVVTGANLALGQSSSAGQTINAKGPRGVLATTTYTRGYNVGYGAFSTANQRLSNQTGR